MVGLLFFIRASVKDRTQQVQLIPQDSVDYLLSQLQTYLTQRAYHISSVNPQQQTITFEGFVSPSWFLAIFLSFLAAVGFFCLSLVLSFLYPSLTPWLIAAALVLCPGAGIFYWKKSGRVEEVLLEVKIASETNPQERNFVIVTAHRDELAQLKQADLLKSAIK